MGVRRNQGEHRGVGLAGADGGEKGIGGEAGETEEPLVERTGVDVVAGAAGGVGAGFVEEAGQVDKTAEAHVGAAGRVAGEVGGGVGDYHEPRVWAG